MLALEYKLMFFSRWRYVAVIERGRVVVLGSLLTASSMSRKGRMSGSTLLLPPMLAWKAVTHNMRCRMRCYALRSCYSIKEKDWESQSSVQEAYIAI